jgi:hypothetical protein
MGDCSLCKCVEPLFVALACAEALEHNAVVGREARSIGRDVQRLISETEYEELTFSHNWLEYPVTEPFAELAFAICVRDMKEKCKIETAEVRKLFDEGVAANEKRNFGLAQEKFITIKTKLLDLAKAICEK